MTGHHRGDFVSWKITENFERPNDSASMERPRKCIRYSERKSNHPSPVVPLRNPPTPSRARSRFPSAVEPSSFRLSSGTEGGCEEFGAGAVRWSTCGLAGSWPSPVGEFDGSGFVFLRQIAPFADAKSAPSEKETMTAVPYPGVPETLETPTCGRYRRWACSINNRRKIVSRLSAGGSLPIASAVDEPGARLHSLGGGGVVLVSSRARGVERLGGTYAQSRKKTTDSKDAWPSQDDADGLLLPSAGLSGGSATTHASLTRSLAGNGAMSLVRSRVLVALLPQTPDHIVEGLLDVDTVLGRGLDEFAAQIASERHTLLGRHLALRHPVGLVAHQHDGGRAECTGARRRPQWRARKGGGSGEGRFLDSSDLMVELLDASERGTRGDAVDQHEALAVADPLVSESGVFLLASGVQNLQHAGLAVNLHLLAVRVFDRRVVRLDKVIQTKLRDRLAETRPVDPSSGLEASSGDLPGSSERSCPHLHLPTPPVCTASFYPP
jgi:hypothetical protein